MANLSALPDLSTVDIQAIQDSGPVHPPILLPPLTTIAENWDSVELCSRNLTTNEESGSDDDEEDSEEEDHSHSSTPGKIQDRNSHRTSCSSSSTPDSETDSSDSEQSDATSDSAGSSSSSSDSDSDSGSSCASSLSGKSKTKYKAANTQHDKTSFSVREANYEKGRVTLRLSTLQFDRKQEVNNGYPNRTAKLPKIESIGTTDVKSCKSNVQTSLCGNLDRIHDSEHDVPKSKGQKPVTPAKRTRQLRQRPSPEPAKVSTLRPARNTKSSPQSQTPKSAEKTNGRARATSGVKRKSPTKALIDPPTTPAKKDENRSVVSHLRPTLHSSQAAAPAIGPSLSDLDSDSDEHSVPDVSEAIRLLDLDSQGSPTNEHPTAPPHNSLLTSGLLRLPVNFTSPTNLNGNTWPSVGYCSSLLQQFVAKSQSGEPPPPPPTLMLPTKGARKCFAPADEPLHSNTSELKNCRRANETTRSSSFATSNLTAPSGSHVEQDLDVMVPMRGLDCHSSHVSPDSGIQSVSGSPFSVHSSPVHPSGTGCNSNQIINQQQTVSVSPCPPVLSPSPPLCHKETKSSSNKRKSNKNKQETLVVQHQPKVKNSRQNHSRSRRPRSCRDSVSALQSGLQKDSSFAQAIQHGMNAALRLKSKDVPEEPTDVAIETPAVSSKKRSSSLKKQSRSKKNEVAAAVECNTKLSVATSELNTVKCEDSLPEASHRSRQSKGARKMKVSSLPPCSPKLGKRKKKRKKHKNSNHDEILTMAAVDPNLQSLLDQLCKGLDRCIISRSISQSAGCDRRPWIFQCRKYALTNSNNNSGNSRAKRKKAADDLVARPPVNNTKRKGKNNKKMNSQVTPVLTTSVETAKEDEPCVTATAVSGVLTAVELLLPLKKRHHHLTASDDRPSVESISFNAGGLHCEPKAEKPSQEQTHSRKRAATGDSVTETTEPIDQGKHKSHPKGRKSRNNKKAKTEGIVEAIAMAIAGKEEPPQQVVETQANAVAPSPVEIEGTGDTLTKKKNRRRKTFNRTGFPSVKKKRKKPPSPVPAATAPQSQESNPTMDSSAPRKKLKLAPKEEEDFATVAEPTSSEAPSGDESNAPPLPAKDQPKRRRTTVVRKRFLPAGLFSNYFKGDPETSSTTTLPADRTKNLNYDPEEHEYGLLPPPFYCEKFIRRTKRDFQLPFDVWWLHEQGKLPGRDNLVPSWNYRKIRSNVYYDVKPPFTNDAEPCNCTLPPPDAKDAESQCCGDDCLNRMVYTECSSQMCPVGDKCMNQRIQRHRWAQGLERFMTKDKGWGVRCRTSIKSGMFILEYVGEVVSDKEFKERMHTIYVHDTHHYCLHLDGGLVIDGHRMGGDGRFVNHSCAPNCEMQKWSVNGLPRMALFALRDIDPLEELSYDYNFSLFNPAEGQPCKCGSAQCRGVIGGKSQRVNVLQNQDVVGSKLPQKLSLQKRKRKTQLQGKTSLSVCSSAINLRPLSIQQRIFVLQRRCFLLRNLDKVRDWRDRQKEKIKQEKQLNQVVGRSTRRVISRTTQSEKEVVPQETTPTTELVKKEQTEIVVNQPALLTEDNNCDGEEIVRCRCRLFDDEGLMVQCEKCETWQHSDCLGPENSKAALEAEHYICSTCAGIPLGRDDLKIVLIPQPENSPEGLTFYLSLYYKDLHLRQGDCVYVLRDHDTPDSERALWSGVGNADPVPRPPHHLPPHVRLSNLDIFQIERMWSDDTGKQFIWGHHFFRPQDTYHEPSRKFYVNEVLSSPIYEAIPIWAVAGRCWVLDPTTFCKGRPVDAVEEHVFICEYRVDRTARLFSKNSRSKFPICTRRYAFKNFVTRLKPQRTYQPHGAPPANSRKSTTELQSVKAPQKNEKSKKNNSKKAKTDTSSMQQPSPAVNPTLVKQKVEGKKLRLDTLLRGLLIKKTPSGSPVEDATHLLHRGRGRMRGRSAKQAS